MKHTIEKLCETTTVCSKLADTVEQCEDILQEVKPGKFRDTIREIYYRAKAAYLAESMLCMAYFEKLKIN